MIKAHIIILFLHIFLSGVLASGDDKKSINWEEEINGLKRELTNRHVDLFHYTDSISFFRGLDAVAKKGQGKSVLEVGMMLQQEVAKLGDPNTHVNFNYLIDTELILPFTCYWFEDGLYATSYWKDYQHIEGKRIVAINDYPIGEVMDSISTLISGVTPPLSRYEVPRMLVWVQVLKFFNFIKNENLEIELEDASGKRSKQIFSLPSPESDRVSVGPDPLPLGWQNRTSFFWDLYFPDQHIYYIQYNKCWSREAEEEFGSGASALFMPSFNEFEKEVLKSIKKQKIDKLVLDLRFNSGGNPQEWTKFVDKIQKTRIAEKANIYLLIGRKTKNAAIINAVDVMNSLSPIMVGEDTGGKPNHLGEVKRFVLTTSNLIVNYSTAYFPLVEEDIPYLTPEIKTPQSFEDYMFGSDAAFEFIKNH